MAAPAPAAVADGGGGIILFQVYDTVKMLAHDNTVSVFDALDTGSFDPDAHSFRDVVRWHLDANPEDRSTVMKINALVIGTDVSLDTPLRDWVQILGLHIDGLSTVIYMSHSRSPAVEYEKIRYALVANAAGLAWPLWDKEDTDPINMQVMGSYDEYRASARRLSDHPDEREDNSMHNLIGLRRGRHLKFVNMHALAASLAHGNRRDPVFHADIERIDEFMRHLRAAIQRSLHPPGGDPLVAMLPIIDLVTTTLDRRYGAAFVDYERRMRHAPLSEAAHRAIAQQKARELHFDQLTTRRPLIDRMRQFVRAHPDATLAQVEAEARRNFEALPLPRNIDVSVALDDARAEHRLAAEAGDWHAENRLIEMYKRAFLAGDQDAPPNKHSPDLYEAMKVRRFSRLEISGYIAMSNALRAIHEQYDGQADREARRNALRAAIDADYSVDAEASVSGNRLAGRMPRQPLAQW